MRLLKHIKPYFTLIAAFTGLSGYATEHILYQQTFENVADAAGAGWSYNGASMTIGSDDYGKFLDLALGQNNGRSGQVTWGSDIFLNKNGKSMLEDGVYTVSFDFCINQVSNNQTGSGFTIFTNHKPVGNQSYRLPWNPDGQWNNFVVSIEQTNTEANVDMEMAVNAPLKTTENEDGSFTYSIDNANAKTFATGEWFTVSALVDVNKRTVKYDVSNAGNLESISSGTWTVPETNENGEPISMYAEGMYVMMARYQSEFFIDNIIISCETKYDHANPPTVALTRLGKTEDDKLDLNLRAYTITFWDGETLHIQGTDGNEEVIEYNDCYGAYSYETTISGTIKAWTTSGMATSELVEVEVDCSPCVLPAATAAITAVSEGFGKTYTLSVSNADVPLRPSISISYVFTGDNGETLTASRLESGAMVEVPGKGVLRVTTECLGYQSTTVSIENNIEYGVKMNYDFARMTKEELAATGFTTWNVLNSDAISGFDNWTARKRMFYWDAATKRVDEETGQTVYDHVYPFGFISEDNDVNVIEYCEIDANQNTAASKHFEGIQVFAGHNLCALYRIGVYNNETVGGNDKYIDIYNLDQTDVVVANKISSYGGNSVHPICATAEEYYAQLGGEDFIYLPVADTVKDEEGNDVETGTYSVHVDVYRIDTACTKLTVYTQLRNGNQKCAAVTAIYNGRVATLTTAEDGATIYYSIDGEELTEVYDNEPVDVGGLVTLRAVAKKDGFNDSEVMTYEVKYYADEEHAVVSEAGNLADCFGWADDSELGLFEDYSVEGPLNEADYAVFGNMTKIRHLDIEKVSSATVPANAFQGLPLISVKLPTEVGGYGSGLFDGCNMLSSVVFNSDAADVTDGALAGAGNPNLLVYLPADKLVSLAKTENIIRGGTASAIVLTDGKPFHAAREFTATEITYARDFTKQSGMGSPAGWEALTVPFDVQRISDASGTVIKPFLTANESDRKFWLYSPTASGWERAGGIEAFGNYIVSMPNHPWHGDEVNISGKVTFSARNVTVARTPSANSQSFRDNTWLVSAYMPVTKSANVSAINDETTADGDAPGSHFVKGLREVRPFECYLTGENLPAKMPIFDSSDIEELMGDSGFRVWSEGSDICIYSPLSIRLMVYDYDGRLMRIASVRGGETTCLTDFNAGIYIVGDTKIYVK